MPRGSEAFEAPATNKKERVIRVSEEDLDRVRDELVTRAEADVIAAHRELGMKKEKVQEAIRRINEQSEDSAPSEKPESGPRKTMKKLPGVFLSREEFKTVADAMMGHAAVTEEDLVRRQTEFGMSAEKIKKAMEMVRLREQMEDERARIDESMVFSPEQRKKLQRALWLRHGKQNEVINAHREFGMTKAQVRRALRVLDSPITNRPANPNAPDVLSPHIQRALEEEEEGESSVQEVGMPRQKEAILTAEELKLLPQIKKDLIQRKNAYPEYLEWRFGLKGSRARRVMDQLTYQGFLLRGDDGVLRIFPEGVLGKSVEAIEQADADEIPGFEPKETPDVAPPWLVDQNAAPREPEQNGVMRRKRGERKPLVMEPDIEAIPTPVAPRRPKRTRQLLKTEEEVLAEQAAAAREAQRIEEERRARTRKRIQNPPPRSATEPVAPKPPTPWLSPTEAPFEPPPLPETRRAAHNRDVPPPLHVPAAEAEDNAHTWEETDILPRPNETPVQHAARLEAVRTQLEVLRRAGQYAPTGQEFARHRAELDAKRHKAEAILAREDFLQAVGEAQGAVDEVTAELRAAKRAADEQEAEIEAQRKIRAELQEALDEKKNRQQQLTRTPEASQTPAAAAELALLNNQIPDLERGLARQAHTVRDLEGEHQNLVDIWKQIHRERTEALAREDDAESKLHSVDAYLAGAAVAGLSLEAVTGMSQEMAQERATRAAEQAAAAVAAQNTRTKRSLRASGKWAKTGGTVLAGTVGVGLGSIAWVFGHTIQFISNPLKYLKKSWAAIKKFIEEAADGGGGRNTPRAQGA